MTGTNNRRTTDSNDTRPTTGVDGSASDGPEPKRDGGGRLTAEQRAILETALEEGYFEVPRKATLLDLAEAHDLSDRATSRQLRHGLETLLSQQLR